MKLIDFKTNEDFTFSDLRCSLLISKKILGDSGRIQLMGDNVFSGDPEDLDLKVYVKDGTTEQLIIGEDIEHGYKDYNSRWTGFYSEWGDNPNRLFQYYPVTRNPAGLSTIMLGYPVKLPSDCRAWVATSIGDGELVLKRVKGDIVPAL